VILNYTSEYGEMLILTPERRMFLWLRCLVSALETRLPASMQSLCGALG